MAQETDLQEQSELQEADARGIQSAQQREDSRQQVLVFIAGPSQAVTRSILSVLEKYVEKELPEELAALIKIKFRDASAIVYTGLLNQYVNSTLDKETREAVLKEQKNDQQKLKAYNAAWGLYELLSKHHKSPWYNYKPFEITFTEPELQRFLEKTDHERVSHKELWAALEFYALHGYIVAAVGQEMKASHKTTYQFCFTVEDEEIYLKASIEADEETFYQKEASLGQLRKQLLDLEQRKRQEQLQHEQQKASRLSEGEVVPNADGSEHAENAANSPGE